MGPRFGGCPTNTVTGWILTAMLILVPTAAGSAGLSISEPTLSPAQDLREPAPSYFILPLSVSLDGIAQVLEERIPVSAGWSEFQGFSDSVEVRYGLTRDPLTLTLEQDHLRVQTQVYYWLEARGDAFGTVTCGSPAEPTSVTIGIDALLGWHDDWRWGSRIKIVPTNFSRRCKPPAAGINFTHLLNAAVNDWAILPLVGAVSEAVAEVGNLEPRIEAAWRALQAPVPTPANGWVSYRVEQIIAGQVGGGDHSIDSEIAFVARPHLTLGKKPSGSDLSLPETRVRLPENRIRVAFAVEVAVDSVETAIRDWLVDRPLPTPEGPANFSGARISGQGDEVVLALELSGAREGTVYLTGTIAYDDETLFLFISGLQWTPETVRALYGADPTPTELAALDELRRSLSSRLHFDLRRAITTSLVQIGRGINQQLTPEVEIKGGAMRREPLGNDLAEGALRVRIAAVGKVTLVVP